MSVDSELKHSLEIVLRMRVYFGHQSVGRNILEGLRDIGAEEGKQIRFVGSDDAIGIPGSYFAESNVGTNTKPMTKCDAFRQIIGRPGFGDSLDVAFLKFCYVDISAETDVGEMFAYYKQTMFALTQQYPKLTIVHMTMPLLTRVPAWKRLMKTMLGRGTPSDLEAFKRSEYNKRVREEFGHDHIFDLAAVESRGSEGSQHEFDYQGTAVAFMNPEFTDDGGHLNTIGRIVVAREMLRTIAEIGEGLQKE